MRIRTLQPYLPYKDSFEQLACETYEVLAAHIGLTAEAPSVSMPHPPPYIKGQ